jgi:hypothetical protein
MSTYPNGTILPSHRHYDFRSYLILDPKLQNIRSWQVKEFNDYLVFYRSLTNRVEILKVIHGTRDIETIFIEQFGL